MSVLAIIGTVLSGIVVPLLALWIKNYLSGQAAAQAAAAQEAADEALAQKNQTATQAAAGSENQAIQNETDAKNAWAAAHKND